MVGRIFFADIVDVIGCHQRDVQFASDSDQVLVDRFQLSDWMSLYLKIEVSKESLYQSAVCLASSIRPARIREGISPAMHADSATNPS